MAVPPDDPREQVRVLTKSRLSWLDRAFTFRTSLRALGAVMSGDEQLIEVLPVSIYAKTQTRSDATPAVCTLTSLRLFVLYPYGKKMHYLNGSQISQFLDGAPLEPTITVYFAHPTKPEETNWFTLQYTADRAVAAARLMFLGQVLSATDCWGDVVALEEHAQRFVREGMSIPYVFRGY